MAALGCGSHLETGIASAGQVPITITRGEAASRRGKFYRLARGNCIEAGIFSPPTMPTLGLSMIVKNAAQDLPDCLASVKGAVDLIVVADTGSTDATRELALAAGATVIQIPWENDFAKARNQSLAAMRTDWVLILDADERLDPGAAGLLPDHLAADPVAGYQVTIRNYLPSLSSKIWDRPAKASDSGYAPARQYPAYVDHENVRLFRRVPGIYFTCRVHETVGNRIVELGLTLRTASLMIHHFGMVRDAEEAAAKADFYRRLGLEKLAEMPNDAQAHFELGIVELENRGKPAEALPYFKKAAELKPRFGVAHFFAGKCEFQLGEYRQSLAQLRQAEERGHRTAAVAEFAGDAHYNLAEYSRACEWYQIACKRAPENANAESKLGLAQVRSGRVTAGLHRVRHAVMQDASNPELHDRLLIVEAWLNHVAEAAVAAENKLCCVTPRPEDFVRAASIRAQLKDWDRAAEILRAGLAKFPDSETLRSTLSKAETLAGARAPFLCKK